MPEWLPWWLVPAYYTACGIAGILAVLLVIFVFIGGPFLLIEEV